MIRSSSCSSITIVSIVGSMNLNLVCRGECQTTM